MAARRGSNFGVVESKQLTISFLHISQDPIVGNGQRAARFWDRVSTHFNQSLASVARASADRVNRSTKSLEAKWNNIKKETTKFAGALTAIQQLDESGTTLEQQIVKALALYKARHSKLEDFVFIECWRLLRLIPKWADLNIAAKKTTPLSDVTNQASVARQESVGGVGNPDTPAMDSDLASEVPAPGCQRPHGSKKAKEAVKRQKTVDNSLLSQLCASQELSQSISEKVSLMKEQAMVAVFSIKDDDGKLFEEGKEFFQLRRARDLARFKRELEKEDSIHHVPQQTRTSSVHDMNESARADKSPSRSESDGDCFDTHGDDLSSAHVTEDQTSPGYFPPNQNESSPWGEMK